MKRELLIFSLANRCSIGYNESRNQRKGVGAMSGDNKTYIAIDLKSFYASAECVSRGLDPLYTNLVVADASRT